MNSHIDSCVVDRNGAALIRIPEGRFLMGSQHHYPEESPVRWEEVAGFSIHATPVTNAMFAAFVADTGYLTQAERSLASEDYPGVAPGLLQPASLVFTPPNGPVELDDVSRWWSLVPGADWRHPLGPDSNLQGLDLHPVVHVGLEDAHAYADWVGCELPTEEEWEFAAWGGHTGSEFVWGDQLVPDRRHMANIWQGEFPWQNLALDGYDRTSPVGAFPANGYGLRDMIGNVWEWTTTPFRNAGEGSGKPSCCASGGGRTTLKVLKGGSHLCAPGYCQRYRAPARSPQAADTTSSHIGFRCIRR
jgi:formylglycine-generating enzyme required for sulfatase activity